MTTPLRHIFDKLDWLNRGFVTKADIKRVIDQFHELVNSPAFLERAHPDSLEMEAMMRRFNKDKQNGKLSMTEFIEELSPKL